MSFLEVVTSAVPFPVPGGCWRGRKDTDDGLGTHRTSKSSVLLPLLLVLERDVVSATCLKGSRADQDKDARSTFGDLGRRNPRLVSPRMN